MKKKRIWTRLSAVLAGLLLFAGSLCALAETFFGVPFTTWAGSMFRAETPLRMLATLVIVLLLGLLGAGCVAYAMPGQKQRSSGFVMQKAEDGTIGVAIKSIEGMVQHCVGLYDVISEAEISVVERRDGIAILLNVQEAAGVNIPLMVGTLQKQIRQHVKDCTGVDVREVRVLVENDNASAMGSPYAVKPVVPVSVLTPAPVAETAEAPEELVTPVAETAETPLYAVPLSPDPAEAEEAEVVILPEQPDPVTVETDVDEVVPEETAAPIAAPAVIPAIPELPEEEDDRPLHQRLFGAEEQPAIVPAPPELVLPPAEEALAVPDADEVQQEPEAEEEPVTESEPVLAELVDEDAVTQVAQVMAYDGMLHAQPVYEANDLADEQIVNPDEELHEQR